MNKKKWHDIDGVHKIIGILLGILNVVKILKDLLS